MFTSLLRTSLLKSDINHDGEFRMKTIWGLGVRNGGGGVRIGGVELSGYPRCSAELKIVQFSF